MFTLRPAPIRAAAQALYGVRSGIRLRPLLQLRARRLPRVDPRARRESRQELIDRLVCGFAIWRDQDRIELGQDLPEEIKDSMKGSAAFLALSPTNGVPTGVRRRPSLSGPTRRATQRDRKSVV